MSRTSKNKSGNRPSKSELLQTTPEQIKRQERALDSSTNQNNNMKYNSTDSEDGFYNSFIHFIGAALIILGIIALGVWGWIQITTTSDEPDPAISPTNFFYVELNERITASTSTDLANEISTIKQSKRAENGSFTNLWITKEGEKISGQAFMASTTNTSLPVMDYAGEEFMYGEYTQNGKSSPYLVFSVTDYEAAYGSLLETEDQFKNALRELDFSHGGDFRDVIIRNQDVRQSGERVFYSFPRQDRLVITGSEAALKEIFRRLRQNNYQTER